MNEQDLTRMLRDFGVSKWAERYKIEKQIEKFKAESQNVSESTHPEEIHTGAETLPDVNLQETPIPNLTQTQSHQIQTKLAKLC